MSSDPALTLLVCPLSKGENDSRGETDIALIRIGKLIGKAGKQVIDFAGPDRHRMVHRNIEPSPKGHRECISCRCFRKAAGSRNGLANALERMSIHIGVRSAKQ